MSEIVIQACRPLRIAYTPKGVLMCLAHESDDTGLCTIKLGEISEWTCFGRTAVMNALKVLEVARLIVVVKAIGKPSQCRIDLAEVIVQVRNPATSRLGTQPPPGRVSVEPSHLPDGSGAATQPPPVPPGKTHPATSRTGEQPLTGTPGGWVDPDPATSRLGTQPPPGRVPQNPATPRLGPNQLRAIGIPSSLTPDKEERNTNTSCAELELVGGEIAEPKPVMTIPVVGKGAGEFAVTEAYVAELAETFPGVEIVQELRRARLWCLDNPTKRKTSSGIRRFLTGWLTRTQNNAARMSRPAAATRGRDRHTGLNERDFGELGDLVPHA